MIGIRIGAEFESEMTGTRASKPTIGTSSPNCRVAHGVCALHVLIGLFNSVEPG